MRYVLYGSYRGTAVKVVWEDGSLQAPAEVLEAVDAAYRASGARVALPAPDGRPAFPDPQATARAVTGVLDRVTGLEEHGAEAFEDTAPLDAPTRRLARPRR